MNLAAKKQMLVRDHKLDPNDFYVVNEKFGDKIIIRRTGIEKIEQQIKMSFEIEAIQCTPYGNKVNVIVYGAGRLKDGDYVKTLASANPDNCSYSHYAEVAEKRCRHRLVLKLARLYMYDIFSQEESEEWSETKNQYHDAVSNVEQMVRVDQTGTKLINATTNGKK